MKSASGPRFAKVPEKQDKQLLRVKSCHHIYRTPGLAQVERQTRRKAS
jgi:hypothetical protein